MDENNLTVNERMTLGHLRDAWNEYLSLPGAILDDEGTKLFKQAIHTAQLVIALRVVKRLDPATWR